MAGALICPACGTKIKAGRARCLRCGESLATSEPAAEPLAAGSVSQLASQYRGWLLAAGMLLSVSLLLVVIARESGVSDNPEPSAAPAATSVAVAARAPAPQVNSAPAPSNTAEQNFLNPDRAGTGSYARGDFSTAITLYQQAIEKNPNDMDSLNNLGLALVRANRAADAVPYFERAIQLNTSSWGPRFNLANAYAALNDWTRAIPAYRAASAALPDDYVTHYNLGLALHKAGQEEAAIPEFLHAIELAPGEASFYLSLGISYERLKKPAEAAQAYEDYLSLAPAAPDAAQVKARIQTLKNPS